jgi:hypothetical protein
MPVRTSRPITVIVGDDYSHKIVLPEEDEDGNAIDWTLATFAAQIRTSAEASGDPLAELTPDTSHTDESPPYVVLSLANTITETLAAGTAVWDFQETRSGRVRTPIGGTVRIIQDVTR